MYVFLAARPQPYTLSAISSFCKTLAIARHCRLWQGLKLLLTDQIPSMTGERTRAFAFVHAGRGGGAGAAGAGVSQG